MQDLGSIPVELSNWKSDPGTIGHGDSAIAFRLGTSDRGRPETVVLVEILQIKEVEREECGEVVEKKI